VCNISPVSVIFPLFACTVSPLVCNFGLISLHTLHGTKCSLLTDIFSLLFSPLFLLSAWVTFLPEGVVLWFWNFAWAPSCPRIPKFWLWLLRGWGRVCRHVRWTISSGVDGGLSRRSSVRSPGSEDPHWLQRKFPTISSDISHICVRCPLFVFTITQL
jgi:hypothetical protein